MVGEGEHPRVPGRIDQLHTPPFVIRNGLSNEIINGIEDAFGIWLPRRYKDFLKVTDGADVDLYDSQGHFTARFLSVESDIECVLTIAEINRSRGSSPLFVIGQLDLEEFGFLWSELGDETEDCQVFQFIQDQGEVCMLARSFVELLTDMSSTRPDKKYVPSFLQESGPVSWHVVEPSESSPRETKMWWQFWRHE